MSAEIASVGGPAVLETLGLRQVVGPFPLVLGQGNTQPAAYFCPGSPTPAGSPAN